MLTSNTFTKTIFTAIKYLIVILLCGMIIFPIYWMFSSGFRSLDDIFQTPPKLMVWPLTTTPLLEALKWLNYMRYLWNTLYIAALSAIGVSLASSIVAYGFTKIEWPGRDIFLHITIATMLLPPALTYIPLYITWSRLGAIGTFLPLWVPAWGGGAFSIFIITQMYRAIPNDYVDAARVEGAPETVILWKIIMPLAKSIIVLVFVLRFTAMWKEFFQILIYIDDKSMYTLTYGLYGLITGTDKAPWNVVMAGAAVVAVPMFLLLPVTRKAFTGDITAGSLK